DLFKSLAQVMSLAAALRSLSLRQAAPIASLCPRLQIQHRQQRRHLSSPAPQQLQPAGIDGGPAATQSSPAVRDLAQRICQLSLLEVAELSRQLQSDLGVSAQPALPAEALKALVGGAAEAASADAAADAGAGAAVKTAFNLKLVKFDAAKKVALIKELKSRNPSLNLVQTKKLVESAPAVVVNDLTKDEAEAMKSALEQIGATIEIE
ncbi:hypothetical protein BOX15_Mlig022342g1, partial [Macrostomum lignano]